MIKLDNNGSVIRQKAYDIDNVNSLQQTSDNGHVLSVLEKCGVITSLTVLSICNSNR